ncbi:MAG: cell wall-binding repeat-containing protein, partial [Flavisolibacter sp.]|nr:cell wall-binding repeat-containing protein [Flavisolibacter sp.]
MQKILLASDGTQFSDAAFDFARQLNNLQPILLTGVFMPQVSYASLWSYTNALGGPAVVPLLETEENETIRKNIRHFENLC